MQLLWRFLLVVRLFAGFGADFAILSLKKWRFSQSELKQQYNAIYHSQAQRFRLRAVEMGGLLVKLGQFLSAHIDILPRQYTAELAKLQDEVQPVEADKIREVLMAQLGENCFAQINPTPLAAASLGQVHLATLHGGEKVAVKVQRPGIGRLIDVDLKAIRLVLVFIRYFTKWGKSLDIDAIFLEFKKTILRELDYEEEGRSAERFASNFAADSDIVVPRVFWEFTTKYVLTLEFMQGRKIDAMTKKEDKENRSRLAEKLFHIYLEQFLVHGFFHADPHPGNILIKDDGRIIFLDFGMVGEVKEQIIEDIRAMAFAVFRLDSRGMVKAYERLGFLQPHADQNTLEQAFEVVLSRSFGGDVKGINADRLAEDMRELLYSQPFQLPADVIFMGKALITVFGLCNGLDKEFNPFTKARPYLEDFLGEKEKGFKGFVETIAGELKSIVSLPSKLELACREIERLSGENRKLLNRQLEHQSLLINRVVYAIFLAAGFISFLLLPTSHNPYLKQGIGISILLVAGALLATFWKEKQAKRIRQSFRLRQNFSKPKAHP